MKTNLPLAETPKFPCFGQEQAYTCVDYHGPEAFHQLRSEWEGLWRLSNEATDVQTWHWQYLYWKHLAPKTKPVVVVTRDAAGKLLALATFYKCRDEASWISKGAFLGDKSPDYQLILSLPNLPKAVGCQILNRFISHFRLRVPFIELSNVPLESYSGAVVNELFGGRYEPDSLTLRWERETYAVPLPKTVDDYQKQLGPRSRRDFSYDRRRLSKEFKVDFRVCDNADGLDKVLDDIEIIDRARWDSGSRYNIRACREFERSLACALSEAGIYRAFLLYLDGKPATFVTGAIVRNALKVRSIGFDRSLAGKLSVGKLCNFFAIEHCIEEGLVEYDLTRGGEDYKKWLGAAPRTNLHVRVYRSRMDRVLENRAKEVVSSLRRQSWLRAVYQSVIRR